MTNNLTDTQQIDLLLQRVNEIDEVIDNKLNRMKNLKEGIFFNPFLEHKNNGYIDIPPVYKTKKYFSKTRHHLSLFLMNKDNILDEELFLMLQLTIRFNNAPQGRAAGTYSYDKIITINRGCYISSFMSKTGTLRHEIGHAWHIQFSKMLGIDTWEMSKYFLTHYLRQLGVNNDYKNFNRYKPYIKEHISDYGSKNELECFAELFKLATQTKKESTYELTNWEYAQNSMRALNIWIKAKLWNKN